MLLKKSPCKVNLILNILGKRADGFHELETVMQPVNLCDELTFERGGAGVQLTCTHPELPRIRGTSCTGPPRRLWPRRRSPTVSGFTSRRTSRWRAASARGSANAAVTLAALNELFGSPLP
jgi:4-diphosphocytidyl-2-C-methyl-D-erythritol kinase